MKSFLESAKICDSKINNTLPSAYITNNIQYDFCNQYYDSNNSAFCADSTNERSVYFLLFMAAINEEL